MMEKSGVIIKGIGGFYYVLADNKIIECKARGLFRNDNVVPLVGDNVIIEIMQTGNAVINKIANRKNLLLRPKVANVDQGALVVSIFNPKPDFLLIDKLIIWTKFNKIYPLLIINKADELNKSSKFIDEIKNQYPEIKTVITSCNTRFGEDELRRSLKNKRTVMCGQSAVGKSTLLNMLFPDLDLETGTLAKKTARGRHTTRHTELFINGDIEVIDTPGFSVLEELPIDDAQSLGDYFGYKAYAELCKFSSCLHMEEPDCGVLNALHENLIHPGRYERYKQILKMVMDKRGKYD